MKDLAGNTSLGNRFSHRSWLQGKSGKHNACYSEGFSQEIAAQALGLPCFEEA